MKKIINIIAIAAISFAGSAFAANTTTPSYAKTGPFIALGAGWSYLGTPEANILGSVTSDEWNTYKQSYKKGAFDWLADIGYNFAISPRMMIGVSTGYKDLGRSKYRSSYTFNYIPAPIFNYTEKWSRRIDQHAIDMLIKLHYFVWRGLNVFGGGGVAFVNSHLKQHYSYTNNHDPNDNVNVKNSKSIWRIRPELVLGLGYMFQNGFAINAMYNYIYGSNYGAWHTTRYVSNGFGSPYSLPARHIYSANMVSLVLSYTFSRL